MLIDSCGCSETTRAAYSYQMTCLCLDAIRPCVSIVDIHRCAGLALPQGAAFALRFDDGGACGRDAVRLGILGPLLVADDAGCEIRVAAARQRVLLAALLVRANRIVPVDE